MPTYEYKCDACGHGFEQFQSITAAPLKKCPQCGKSKVRRLIGTGAGLLFKGSGFYITDYRSEGYKEKAKSEAPAAPAEAAGSQAAAADSKAAAAPDTKSAAPAAKTESKPSPAPKKPKK